MQKQLSRTKVETRIQVQSYRPPAPARLMFRLLVVIGLTFAALMLPLAWYAVVTQPLSDGAAWAAAWMVALGFGGGGIAAAWIVMELRFPGYLTGGGRE